MQGMFPRSTSFRFAYGAGLEPVTLAKHAYSRLLSAVVSSPRFLVENWAQNSIQVFGLFRDFGELSRRVKRGKNGAQIGKEKRARLRPFV